jgi:hypothetical protein
MGKRPPSRALPAAGKTIPHKKQTGIFIRVLRFSTNAYRWNFPMLIDTASI